MKKSNSNNKENVKMKKYIVEAPELQKGQKVSSGGIRENGKLIAQFKNPVPYNESVPKRNELAKLPNSELFEIEQNNKSKQDGLLYVMGIVWEELGEPVCRTWLHNLGQCIANKITSSSCHGIQRTSKYVSQVVDVEEN